jgi:hypothetical protein
MCFLLTPYLLCIDPSMFENSVFCNFFSFSLKFTFLSPCNFYFVINGGFLLNSKKIVVCVVGWSTSLTREGVPVQASSSQTYLFLEKSCNFSSWRLLKITKLKSNTSTIFASQASACVCKTRYLLAYILVVFHLHTSGSHYSRQCVLFLDITSSLF